MGYFTKSNSLLGRISLRNLFTWWENGRAPGAEKSVPGLNLPPESKGGSPSETILEEVTLRDGGRGVGHVVGTEAPTLLFPRVSCGTHRTSDPSEERRWEQWGRRGRQQAACFVAATLLLIQARKGCLEKTAAH